MFDQAKRQGRGRLPYNQVPLIVKNTWNNFSFFLYNLTLLREVNLSFMDV